MRSARYRRGSSVPLDVPLDALSLHEPDGPKLISYLKAMELNSLTRRVAAETDTDVEQIEPYFTGAILKDYELIQNTRDRDGAYGEGYGYYNFSMDSWSERLPAVENVFNVDLSERLNGSYKELVWASNIKENQFRKE